MKITVLHKKHKSKYYEQILSLKEMQIMIKIYFVKTEKNPSEENCWFFKSYAFNYMLRWQLT